MSLAERLYRGSPVWLQNALLTARGAAVARSRYGRTFRAELERAREQLAWPPEAIRAFVAERVRELVARAAAEHPYYRRTLAGVRTDDLALADLASLPTVDRVTLRANADAFLAYARAEDVVGTTRTSGTTGMPLRVPYTRAARQTNYAYYERYLETLGLSQFQPHAALQGQVVVPAGTTSPPFHRISRWQNVLFLSSYHIGGRNAEDYLAALRRFGPRWIECYPSSAHALAGCLGRRLREIEGLSALVTSGETLSPEEREAIEDAFGVPVHDHYGAAEMCALIAQCRSGRYHVHQDFAWVELLPLPDTADTGTREIVCTSWSNPAFPFVRYRIGDLAGRDTGAPCDCGLPFPTVARIEGRADDCIVTPAGTRVGRLSPVAKGLPAVRVQYHQTDRDRIRVRVVPEAGWDASCARRLEQELAQRVGPDMRIEVEVVSELGAEPGRKLRLVVSDVARRPGHEAGS